MYYFTQAAIKKSSTFRFIYLFFITVTEKKIISLVVNVLTESPIEMLLGVLAL